MICLLIVSSHEGALEAEIRADASGEFVDLVGVPRALLPSGVEDKRIIDIWWDAVSKRHIFEKGGRQSPQPRHPPFVILADLRAALGQSTS